MKHSSLAPCLLSCLLLLVLSCGKKESPSPDGATPTPSTAPSAEAKTPGGGGVDRQALFSPASLSDEAPATYTVDFKTTAGEFSIECHRDWSPLGADRFYNLVKHGFFDEVRFFRVVSGFVVQFGIHGDPEIGSAWKTAKLQDDPVLKSNLPGTISFATSGKNTRTTQVFINYGNNAGLDSMGFSPFGRVVSGMEVVSDIYSEYREQASQPMIQSEGNAYLMREFPKMDFIKTARLR